MSGSVVFVAVALVFVSVGEGHEMERSTDIYLNMYNRPDYTKESPRQLTSSSSTGPAYYDEDFGNLAQASGGGGYGHGHGHGGGHGGGWGWGGGGGYGGGKKGGCNSALGLLGVIGLASYLQNVLRQMSTTATAVVTTVATGKRGPLKYDDQRIRRSLEPDGVVDSGRISAAVMPFVSAAAHVRDGLISSHCVLYPACKTNHLLVKELGLDNGSRIGNLISEAVSKFISYGKKSKVYSKLLDAAKAGRYDGGRACDNYEQCAALDSLPAYTLPPALLK